MQPAGGPVYRDIRQYLAELDRRGLLIRVTRMMSKDTEVMPLVRWEFRGLDQSQRKGWLFENLTGRDLADKLNRGMDHIHAWRIEALTRMDAAAQRAAQ